MHFQNWLETPQGRYVLQWELAKHELLLADVFGFNAVQVGLSHHDYLRGNRMPFRIRCARESLAEVQADPWQLPFGNHSVDLVVLPHVLEFAENPHLILREVERVLVPEGQVVVTGFNPFSLWSAHRHLFHQSVDAPWNGRYISVLRLKDWFALLGFETRGGAFGCYAPPFSQEKWLHRCHFLEAAGDRWWPYGGAVYVLQAIKRQAGMRLVMPTWNDRKARAKALVAVTQRNGR